MAPRIVLIGPPGAGKTSVGKSLASNLSLSFADTDHLVETQAGKSVAQIFIDDGEAQFRNLEANVCLLALSEQDGVLSLGGGAVLTPSVAASLKATPLNVVFLDVTLAVAAPRIGFNRDRPLLLGNPRQQWQTLMDARRPIYEDLASLKVSVENKSVNEISTEIISKLGLQ